MFRARVVKLEPASFAGHKLVTVSGHVPRIQARVMLGACSKETSPSNARACSARTGHCLFSNQPNVNTLLVPRTVLVIPARVTLRSTPSHGWLQCKRVGDANKSHQGHTLAVPNLHVKPSVRQVISISGYSGTSKKANGQRVAPGAHAKCLLNPTNAANLHFEMWVRWSGPTTGHSGVNTVATGK